MKRLFPALESFVVLAFGSFKTTGGQLMRRGTLLTLLAVLCVSANMACGGGSGLGAGNGPVSLSAPTTMVVGTTASVTGFIAGSVPDSTAGNVIWSCTPSTSCGTSSFKPDKTQSASASVFTAPATIPAGGQVTITGTSAENKVFFASQAITITAANVNTQNFSFYATGVKMDVLNGLTDIDPYSVAGVVSIASDGSGTVVGGEQDFGDADRIVATGDTIMSGSLVLNPDGSGNGTLTLKTNDPNVGVSGTETFAVAFANTDHALITQFDGTATSNGSMDLQTSTAAPSGSFSFVTWGIESAGEPFTEGGVFTVDASGNVTGKVDTNDAGQTVTPGVALPAGTMLTTPDVFGRGAVNPTLGFEVSVHYYVVSPKVIRIIDVDNGNAAVGSAYSQGATPNFSNASIGASVFSLGKTDDKYSAAGQITTGAGGANKFAGVADLNESAGALLPAKSISGTYALAADGYGSASFDAGFGSVQTLGIYAVDSALNILDPNNTSGGGGALLTEMDANHVGIGVLIPQTDSNAAHFTGDYTLGAQGRNSAPEEFDFIGEATVTAGAFSGAGILSDPFMTGLTGTGMLFPDVTFTATAVPDSSNHGRLKFTPLVLSSTGFASPIDLTFTAYQANAGQLFWVGMDSATVSAGSMEQNTLDGAVPGKKPKTSSQTQ